jgi:hypothetical protein
VRPDKGAIELQVAPLHIGGRFRIITADGEGEVRGTNFKAGTTWFAARQQKPPIGWRGANSSPLWGVFIAPSEGCRRRNDRRVTVAWVGLERATQHCTSLEQL